MASTLTPTQILRFRRTIGDHDPDDAGDYDLTDTEIQDAWNEAGGVEPLTFVLLLRQRYGISINLVDATTELAATARTQKTTQIKTLLDFWTKLAGAGATAEATVGELSLGIDEEDSEITNP